MNDQVGMVYYKEERENRKEGKDKENHG